MPPDFRSDPMQSTEGAGRASVRRDGLHHGGATSTSRHGPGVDRGIRREGSGPERSTSSATGSPGTRKAASKAATMDMTRSAIYRRTSCSANSPASTPTSTRSTASPVDARRLLAASRPSPPTDAVAEIPRVSTTVPETWTETCGSRSAHGLAWRRPRLVERRRRVVLRAGMCPRDAVGDLVENRRTPMATKGRSGQRPAGALDPSTVRRWVERTCADARPPGPGQDERGIRSARRAPRSRRAVRSDSRRWRDAPREPNGQRSGAS